MLRGRNHACLGGIEFGHAEWNHQTIGYAKPSFNKRASVHSETHTQKIHSWKSDDNSHSSALCQTRVWTMSEG